MKRAMFIMIAAMLLLAACGQTATGPDLTRPFIGGKVGVGVGLIDGMPPAAVYDKQRMNFGVGASLHNLGEADIGPNTPNPFVRVSLDGFSPRAFGLTASEMTRDLDRPLLGSKKNFDGTILPGQLANIVFEPLSYQDQLQGNFVQNMVVRTCYDYENWATAPICFKNEIYQTAQDICSLTGEKFPQNSGGPLHVTSLVQNPLGPYKVMISFVLEHVGTGDFYGRTAEETCNPNTMNMNKYKVEVAVTSRDPEMGIECSTLSSSSANRNRGTITLFAGAPQTVTCTLTAPPGSGNTIFTDPIMISAKYRYGEMLTQPIIIQAVGDR